MPISNSTGSNSPPPIIVADHPVVVPCEVGGGFQIGFADDAPSFPSRTFALAVAASTGSAQRSPTQSK